MLEKKEISENSSSALTPNVKRLGLVSFLADISSEMLYPITPIFLTTVLGASVASVGVIEGFAEAIASLLKTYSGFWSDRIRRRKPFIWGGYLLAAVAKPLIGVSQVWGQVLFARGLDRTGKGLRTAPRDALLAESVPPHLRGAAFGWHRMMDTLGAAIGPLLAIVYLKYSSNLRFIYFLALIPGLLAVIAALRLKEERREQVAPSYHQTWASFFSLPKEFKHYLFSWTVFSLANSSDAFLLLRMQQAGIPLTETILLYCFYNLVYALASPYLGGLSDRVGRKRVLLFGLVIFALVYTGFAFATHESQFWVLFGVYGLYMAATDGVGKAFAIDLLNKDMKATAVGYLGTVTGISTLIASSVAGLLWDHYGSAATFAYGAVGAVLTVMTLIFLKVPRKTLL
ncbi:MFS transporter [Bdellovibrio svalbardensis]|uniref:MFS transporter n=1 Tax=Bdellovibrio svalbardensis TaxID=2972972 RepID=A0ABT6DSM8_9BACT|nr:MFS transporter [Bdellovibrio svalbardensis]MDG0818148.1 MFS transporter [Bdellovibrio svalbardensis]